MHRPEGPIPQAWANERYAGLVRDNAQGQDVIAALNMLWLYLRDAPRAWHESPSYGYSFKHASAIMGLDWRFRDWSFRPKAHWIEQMRIYGVEEDSETGRLKVANVWRWRHALSIARQTGRCPPSTFHKRINDPECEPTDPVDPFDLPPLHRNFTPVRYKPGAAPQNIEREMKRVGWGEHTYDARRERWFRGEALSGAKSTSVPGGRNLSFAAAARSALERLAR